MRNDASKVRSVVLGIGLAIGAIGVGQFVVLLTATGLLAIGISIYDSPTLRLGVSTVMVQGVTFGGIALVYLRLSQRGLRFIRSRVPTRRDLAWTVGGFVGLLAALWMITTITEYFGIQSAENQIVTLGQEDPSVFLLLILFSFLLVGPSEELLYRGVIQGRLRETFSAPRAVILASALFAAIHGPSLQGDGKWVYIVTVFVLALILGTVYEYTDNIVVPALIHGGYNATLFAAAYISATRGDVAIVAPNGHLLFTTLLAILSVIMIFNFDTVFTKFIGRGSVVSLIASNRSSRRQYAKIMLITLGALPLAVGLYAVTAAALQRTFHVAVGIVFGY